MNHNTDIEFEQKLRPSSFGDFTGQDKIRERLELFVQAAKERNDVLDHVSYTDHQVL